MLSILGETVEQKSTAPRILVIDDEPRWLKFVRDDLGAVFNVEVVSNLKATLKRLDVAIVGDGFDRGFQAEFLDGRQYVYVEDGAEVHVFVPDKEWTPKAERKQWKPVRSKGKK